MISIPGTKDFEFIKAHIKKFELDGRDLDMTHFCVVKNNNILKGFGRIKKHNGCDELCTLGVMETERNKGYGRKLTRALVQRCTQPLYLVCIIPDYFYPLNFKIVHVYPKELQEKLDYCNRELAVQEKYVVMKYKKPF